VCGEVGLLFSSTHCPFTYKASISMVPIVSAAISGLGVFERDGEHDMRYYALSNLPQPILSYYGGITIHVEEVVDSAPFTISVTPSHLTPPPSTT